MTRPPMRFGGALAPMLVLGVVTVATSGAVAYSHFAQVWDKQVMRAGVERDKERLKWKRRLKPGLQQQQGDKQH